MSKEMGMVWVELLVWAGVGGYLVCSPQSSVGTWSAGRACFFVCWHLLPCREVIRVGEFA